MSINLHYISMLLSGLNLFILVWLLLRFLKYQSRGIPSLNYCLLIMTVGIVFGLAATLGLLLPDGPVLQVCALVMMASSLATNTFFALMVFNLAESRRSFFYRHQRVFVWVLLALIPLYLTDGWHHLILDAVPKRPGGFGFDLVYGPASLAISVYAYLVTALAVVSVMQAEKDSMLQKTWTRLAVLGATVLQAIFSGLEQMFPLFYELQISLFTTWMPMAVISYLFFGYLLTGRNTALDLVDDAYVAFDLNGYCVDINREGTVFFQRYCGATRPTVADMQRLLEVEDLPGYTGGEMRLYDGEVGNYYRVSTFELSSGINQRCGVGYIIREITEFVDQMEALNTIATQDPLTGAKNRRYLEEHAPAILARARKRGQPLAALMLDIDFFKKVNDTHGHPVGDEVLVRLQQILQANLRENDIVVRYGGEEFLALCEGLSWAQACQLAGRIRHHIEQTAFETSAGRLAVTVSIGVFAGPPGEDDTIGTYIEGADEKLYEAKNSGRNRVC
ncbi:diguanylate cyclase [Ruminococcaceae bacterium OttesenSCG-928-D13]|nr:diguanylate cyclase [Ruminococcaceae bacterium OttesenSCG-928-D13]